MPKIRHSYQLHIQLCDIKPAIWRRLVVSDCTNLAQLHRLIQAAMGWSPRHAAAVIEHYARVSPDESDGILAKLELAKGGRA